MSLTSFKRKKFSCRPVHFKSDIYFNSSLQPPWFALEAISLSFSSVIGKQ